MMDHGACNVIYLDRKAQEELVKKETLFAIKTSGAGEPQDYFNADGPPTPIEVKTNIESILSTFNQVHVCRSGASCLAKLASLLQSPRDNTPTIVLVDIPYDEDQRLKRTSREPRTPSPTSSRSAQPVTDPSPEAGDVYGIRLLSQIFSEMQSQNWPKLIVPVVVLSGFEREWASSNLPSPSVHGSQVLSDTVRLTQYIDAGAVDVFTSPLSKDHIQGLAIHAYRVYKDACNSEAIQFAQKRRRKISWVGVDDTKPYAYLREAMVSGLMGHIINPETVGREHDLSVIEIPAERCEEIAAVVGTWAFSAHDFTHDELIHAALLMLQHALDVPELEKWRMSTNDLITFLQACRHAYNDFVLYHNFRHVVDVLQAVFFFLVRIGTLPQYPKDSSRDASRPSAIASLLKPRDALTLLVCAIGHDVGHPGVNNAFLVALNAPLAQLYNDRSVLESFHCAAYSQILRKYWPAAFEDMGMRKLMINSILATDMGLHFRYMADLGNLQEKLDHNKHTLDGWNLKVLEEYRDLACGVLIKCADISNVARKFDTAAQWATILTDEFSNQGIMEIELEIPTQLFGGPPVLDDIVKMGESQIGFMNIFARPLFEAVTHILPAMQFSVDEMLINKSVWERKIQQERDRAKQDQTFALQTPDGTTSPLTRDETGNPLPGGDEEVVRPMRLEPLSTSLTADAQAQLPEIASGDTPVAAFLMKQRQSLVSTGSPERRKKKDRGCGTSVRSLSPSKRKANKPRERSIITKQEQEQSRPRTSPVNHSRSNETGGGANGSPYAHMNGDTVNSSVTDAVSVGKSGKFSSMTDVSCETGSKGKNRRSKFGGFGKLWKKRWRTSSAPQTPPNAGNGESGEVKLSGGR